MSTDTITWQTAHSDVVEVYASEVGHELDGARVFTEWRYRVRAANQKVVEIGSEGYTRRSAAIRAAKRHHPEVTGS